MENKLEKVLLMYFSKYNLIGLVIYTMIKAIINNFKTSNMKNEKKIDIVIINKNNIPLLLKASGKFDI